MKFKNKSVCRQVKKKIIADYYKKNLNAVQSLKGMLFEDKILKFYKI